MNTKEECPSCGQQVNASEMDDNENDNQLLCPNCGEVIIENYRDDNE
jgi:predicted RNA-binding Zn-ribbon protein involved in translation (DUF1610 family)